MALKDRLGFQNFRGHVQGHLKEGLSSLIISIAFVPLIHGVFGYEDATSQANLEPTHFFLQQANKSSCCFLELTQLVFLPTTISL
jgi:hypothetical protein